MISRYEIDLLATNLLPILARSCRATDAEIPKKIENVVRFNIRVEAAEDFLIHLVRIGKWSRAVTDDIGVAEMKIRSEPDVRHGIAALASD